MLSQGGKSVGTIEQTRQVWDWSEIFSILDHISCFLGIVMIRNNDLILLYVTVITQRCDQKFSLHHIAFLLV